MWFTAHYIAAVPETEGVFQLLAEDKQVLQITGTMNLRQAPENRLAINGSTRSLVWEENPVYTRRESELIQQFLQQRGHLPGMGGELDNLYEDRDGLF